ncbi:MAG: nitroreductase family protein [Chloroflexota bacterium]|nr:nitroreductase family protein [Chloroflexota bacterium]
MAEQATRRDVIRLLRDLRAVRDFAPEPVPEAFLDDAYEVARWTGSARNLQPWDLVVVRSRETLDQLAALNGYAKHLAGAPLGIVLVLDNKNAEFAAYDEGRLAERIMLTAAAHGLGSCIGWWSGRGRIDARAIIGAPDTAIARTVLSIGCPALPGGLKPKRGQAETRKPVAAFVHQERYA